MRTHRRIFRSVLGAGMACAAVLASTGTAQAGGAHGQHPPQAEVLDSSVLAPFQLDVVKHSLFVADGFTSTVSKLTGDGLEPVFTTGQGLGALGINRRGDVAYGIRTDGPDPFGPPAAANLTIRFKHGGTKVVDLLAYEQAKNPDARTRYGIDHPTQCQRDAFANAPVPVQYTGQPDSHPYAAAPLGDNAWVVADAGGNDLLKVDNQGHVSTLAVLPRQPVAITASGAAALGLADCVIGAVYNFEPVPTDVIPTRHGFLVSLLPGGPEDPSLGARGAVYSVGRHGAHRIAGGFAGATNLALDPHGNIYVAELFGGQISKISHGKTSVYVTLPGALSVEWGNGTLYAGTFAPTDDEGNPTGPGTIVAIH